MEMSGIGFTGWNQWNLTWTGYLGGSWLKILLGSYPAPNSNPNPNTYCTQLETLNYPDYWYVD